MDKVSESIFSTLKRVKNAIVQDLFQEDSVEDDEKRGSAVVEADLPSSNSTNEDHHRVRQKRHSRVTKTDGDSSDGCSTTLPKKRFSAVTKPKDNTLLALAQSKNSDSEPNSATGRRVRSMKFAHSMTSVYRKINKDKNVHNDRHYLVAVTEQIKTDCNLEGKGKKQ